MRKAGNYEPLSIVPIVPGSHFFNGLVPVFSPSLDVPLSEC